MKRLIDVILATTALAASAPLLAVLSAAIRVDSPGPVLFRQVRVGLNRRPIETLKLRTMCSSAAGPKVTASGDHRVTRVGSWLRKTKLDELPQLWNVIKGDMSLVGPRPEVPYYVDTYRPEWERLFSVRPGLTDEASLRFRNEEELLATARDHDRAYREVIMPLKLGVALTGVERSSVWHDLGVLARTIRVVFRGSLHDPDSLIDEARRRIADLNRESEV